MELDVTALNSGSNGNCYYIGNKEEAILVDAGISCREIVKRMKRLELSIEKVKAIFISHEHSDHIKGVQALLKVHKIPVFITPGTLQNSGLNPVHPLIYSLSPYSPVQIGNLSVTAFPKFHDAQDPQSFVINYYDLCVGVFTDIGVPCEHVVRHFKCCNAIFLETNYDTEMLRNGFYPYYLKRRISGDKGHLSNQQALELFLANRPSFLSHLFLSHISKENNDPELVYNLFQAHANDVNIVLTSRKEEIPVYKIANRHQKKSSPLLEPLGISDSPGQSGAQLALNF